MHQKSNGEGGGDKEGRVRKEIGKPISIMQSNEEDQRS